MTVFFRYLPLEEALSLVSSSQEVFSSQYRDRNLRRGVATPVVISGHSKLFRDNQSYSRTIWAKSRFSGPFRDTGKKSGTVPEIPVS